MSDINLSNVFNYAKDTFLEGKSQAKLKIEPHLEKIGALANKILSQLDKELAIPKQFVRNAKNITLFHLNWHNPEFKDYLNYSWKTRVTHGPLATHRAKLEKRYGGNSYRRVFQRNLLYACSFQNQADARSEQEKKEIATLVAHRRIYNELADVMTWGTASSDNAHKEIVEMQSRCDALAEPDSPKVVHVQNSYSSFSFPAGSRSHTISLECQRDAKGQYFFVIHNRGEAANDPELHGKTVFYWPEGTYARTSVKIAVSLEQIKNSEFLSDLMKAKDASTMDPCYSAIKKHLLQPNGTNIVVSEDEISFKAKQAPYFELLDQIDDLEKSEPSSPALPKLKEIEKRMAPELRALAERIIQTDPGFHTIQNFGSCIESNLTGPEKAMASPQIRRELKLASINLLAREVARSRVIRPRQFGERAILLKHHQFRQQQLSEKITQNKPRL